MRQPKFKLHDRVYYGKYPSRIVTVIIRHYYDATTINYDVLTNDNGKFSGVAEQELSDKPPVPDMVIEGKDRKDLAWAIRGVLCTTPATPTNDKEQVIGLCRRLENC